MSSFEWSLVQLMSNILMMSLILFPIACLPILFRAESKDRSFPDLLKLYMLARMSSLRRVGIPLFRLLITTFPTAFAANLSGVVALPMISSVSEYQ